MARMLMFAAAMITAVVMFQSPTADAVEQRASEWAGTSAVCSRAVYGAPSVVVLSVTDGYGGKSDGADGTAGEQTIDPEMVSLIAKEALYAACREVDPSSVRGVTVDDIPPVVAYASTISVNTWVTDVAATLAVASPCNIAAVAIVWPQRSEQTGVSNYLPGIGSDDDDNDAAKEKANDGVRIEDPMGGMSPQRIRVAVEYMVSAAYVLADAVERRAGYVSRDNPVDEAPLCLTKPILLGIKLSRPAGGFGGSNGRRTVTVIPRTTTRLVVSYSAMMNEELRNRHSMYDDGGDGSDAAEDTPCDMIEFAYGVRFNRLCNSSGWQRIKRPLTLDVPVVMLPEACDPTVRANSPRISGLRMPIVDCELYAHIRRIKQAAVSRTTTQLCTHQTARVVRTPREAKSASDERDCGAQRIPSGAGTSSGGVITKFIAGFVVLLIFAFVVRAVYVCL